MFRSSWHFEFSVMFWFFTRICYDPHPQASADLTRKSNLSQARKIRQSNLVTLKLSSQTQKERKQEHKKKRKRSNKTSDEETDDSEELKASQSKKKKEKREKKHKKHKKNKKHKKHKKHRDVSYILI